MLSIPLVNDSELHDQSHFEFVVHFCIVATAHSCAINILTVSTHTASRNLICGLTSDLHLGMWHLPRESVSNAGSYLKKSLTIKNRGKGWLKMDAEQHRSSNANWNSNVFSCVAVSSLISYALSGKDLTWDSNNAIMFCSCSRKQIMGKVHPNMDSTLFPCYFTLHLPFF